MFLIYLPVTIEDFTGTTLPKEKRVTVLGLDGATFNVIRPLAERGVMPHLKKLFEESESKVLRSTFPPHTAAAWTAFSTGVNPGKHGIFEWTKYSKGKNPRIVDSRDIKADTVYELLRDEGRTCCTVNLPLSTPAKIDGVVVKIIVYK